MEKWNLKLKFMLVVLEFISNWYGTKKDIFAEERGRQRVQRFDALNNLRKELRNELES